MENQHETFQNNCDEPDVCSGFLSISQLTYNMYIEDVFFITRLLYNIKKFLVSKETVVLRLWDRSKQKFGFIKRVDKGEITTVKDLEIWRFER